MVSEWTRGLRRWFWPEPAPPPQPLTFEAVLQAEQQAIRTHEEARRDPDRGPTALCLSGGGIRSATFALGILQGLAKHKLLSCFDYLSTVSGGGYIGSWLSAWIHRTNATGSPAAIESPLAAASPGSGRSGDDPVGWLRRYSNFLSPRLGLASSDVWTLIATVVRNLTLNWLLLIPLLGAVLLLPRLLVAVIRLPIDYPAFCAQPDTLHGLLAGGAFFGACAVWYSGNSLPRHHPRGPTGVAFVWNFLSPLMLSAFLLETYWAWSAPQRSGEVPPDELTAFIAFGILLHAARYLPPWRSAVPPQPAKVPRTPASPAHGLLGRLRRHVERFLESRLFEVLAVLGIGGHSTC